jgi:purine-nucleoside phosphorylase
MKQQIDEAVAFLKGKTKQRPEHFIILGTGLGALAREIEVEVEIPYGQIPHFVHTTVKGHEGKLICGKLGGRPVMAMEGRFHCYEGYSPQQVTMPVRIARAMGAGTLVVSGAVGGLNPQYKLGDLVLIEDHINFMGVNPLIGPNDDAMGPRYPDMIEPYSHAFIESAESILRDAKVRHHRGVYVGVLGPNLETRAEYRMLRQWGADVVGMSTVPETIVAVHGGMKVLGVAVVTDLCLPDALEPANIEKIIAVAKQAEPALTNLVRSFVSKISA